MSGFDNVIINVRERPLSTDINNLQSLIARDVLNMMKWMLAENSTPLQPGVQGVTPQSYVLGGLNVLPSGTDVAIQPGALVQLSAALPPVPGPLDSDYRVAFQQATIAQTPPSPVGDTWYLLQAQMIAVTTVTTSRDILDPMTGAFNAQLVPKQSEYQLSYNFKAGSIVQVPPADPDFIPIAGVFRPAGGGVVTADQILDCRPLWIRSIREITTDAQASIESAEFVGQFNNLLCDFSGYVGGRRLFARTIASTQPTTGGPDINTPPYRAPGQFDFNPATGFRWNYIYLVQPRALPVRNAQPGFEANALVVVSNVVPNASGTNSSGINLPTPYQGVLAPAGTALLVAAWPTAGGSAFVRGVSQSRSGRGIWDFNFANNLSDHAFFNGNAALSGFGLPNQFVGSTSYTFNVDTDNNGVAVMPHGCDTIVAYYNDSAIVGATPRRYTASALPVNVANGFPPQIGLNCPGGFQAQSSDIVVPTKRFRGTHTIEASTDAFLLMLRGWQL